MNTKANIIDYKDTLNLPKTDFPMKANLVVQEPKTLEFWQELNLYQLLQDAHQQDPVFAFQDGPPYANGDLHLGHAFNKILKDFVIKTKNFSGYAASFVPGWDCHGLPIEIQVEKKLGKQSHQLDKVFFINKCREYAALQVANQKQQFIRLGVLADWQKPYLTMDFKFEAEVMRTIGKILANGHIVRGDRPVHWCLNCGSALAEAEVEYQEKKSLSTYVAFDCKDNLALIKKFKLEQLHNNYNLTSHHGIAVLIWTTTPWTLPAIYAISINPKFSYGIVYFKDLQRNFIVALELLTKIISDLGINPDYEILTTVAGCELEYLNLQHPIYSERTIPVILGEHVTLEMGTGCVTTAPAHGYDDYIVGKKYNLPIINLIDERGCFLATSKFFTGLHINKATDKILSILQQQHSLLDAKEVSHNYPHCWRHKTPVIFMATPQWFISMQKQHLRANALAKTAEITWIPSWGQTRMEGMLVADRPDWCISRQRSWGVPIPFFLHKETKELHPDQVELIEAVAQKVELEGIEAWHKLDLSEILGDESSDYLKSNDIVDVWFESGAVSSCIQNIFPNQNFQQNLYLEGSDQHRGWFQSSLLISMGVHNVAPYKQVLTHGFILDAEGNKMSKSLGNIISPQAVINKYGADLLRLWVATTDYSGDLKISEEILSRASEAYRRIRNTARFLLSNLHDWNANTDLVSPNNMLLLDLKMLQTTMQLQDKILECYDQYKFHLAYQKIHNFCVEELGSFYLDIIKDRQYTCKKDSIPRRSAQTVLYYILQALVRWIAPILSFTAEEIWNYIPTNQEKSVFLTRWYDAWPDLSNHSMDSEEFWETMFRVKKEVNKKIELARNQQIIGSNLEAVIKITCDSRIFTILQKFNTELKFFLIVSTVELVLDPNSENNHIEIAVSKSSNPKCNRCWHRAADLDPQGLCARCNINLTTLAGESRKYA